MQNLDVPDTKEFYQVAQLYIGADRQPWIIGRAPEMKYDKFLEEILKEKNLPIAWKEQEFFGEKVNVPSWQGQNGEYRVVGIGTCTKLNDVYHFFDADSLTYSKIDEAYLIDFQRLNPDFGYVICHAEPLRPQPITKFRVINGKKQ